MARVAKTTKPPIKPKPRPAAKRTRSRAKPKTTATAPPASQLERPQLSTDAAAIWDAVAPTLEADGRLQPGDELVFAQFCTLTARQREAEASIDRDGLVLGGEGTGVRLQKNPAVNIARESGAAAAKIARDFGMTAGSRRGLGRGAQKRGAGVASVRASLEA